MGPIYFSMYSIYINLDQIKKLLSSFIGFGEMIKNILIYYMAGNIAVTTLIDKNDSRGLKFCDVTQEMYDSIIAQLDEPEDEDFIKTLPNERVTAFNIAWEYMEIRKKKLLIIEAINSSVTYLNNYYEIEVSADKMCRKIRELDPLIARLAKSIVSNTFNPLGDLVLNIVPNIAINSLSKKRE